MHTVHEDRILRKTAAVYSAVEHSPAQPGPNSKVHQRLLLIGHMIKTTEGKVMTFSGKTLDPGIHIDAMSTCIAYLNIAAHQGSRK